MLLSSISQILDESIDQPVDLVVLYFIVIMSVGDTIIKFHKSIYPGRYDQPLLIISARQQQFIECFACLTYVVFRFH